MPEQHAELGKRIGNQNLEEEKDSLKRKMARIKFFELKEFENVRTKKTKGVLKKILLTLKLYIKNFLKFKIKILTYINLENIIKEITKCEHYTKLHSDILRLAVECFGKYFKGG